MTTAEKPVNINFKESISNALHNDNLTGALGRFSVAYRTSRAKAWEGKDFQAVRTQIAERKGYAAGHLDQLAEEFKKNAEARGAKVLRTSDINTVNEYILDVAKKHGVTSVVKSKSMASEEIGLNHFLEKNGVAAYETDLGEWIVQLAGQKPSHMVMPAIHLTKEQVTDLFSKELNERLTTDIPQLVQRAR